MKKASKQSAGGRARAAKLTKEDRSRIAREAALKRWGRASEVVPPPIGGVAHIYGMGPSPDGPLKIGYSTWLDARKDAVQSGNPLELHLWFTVEVPNDDPLYARRVERKAHHMLRERRIRGEWFDVDTETAEQVARSAAEEVAAGHHAPEHDDGSTTLLYLGDERLARVRSFAQARGLKLGDALTILIGDGLGQGAAHAAESPHRAKLDTSMVPQAGTFEVRPLQKAGPKRKWRV